MRKIIPPDFQMNVTEKKIHYLGRNVLFTYFLSIADKCFGSSPITISIRKNFLIREFIKKVCIKIVLKVQQDSYQ